MDSVAKKMHELNRSLNLKIFGSSNELHHALDQLLGDNYEFTVESDCFDNLLTINVESLNDEEIRKLRQILYSSIGRFIYFDEAISLPEVAITLLKLYHKKVGVAESVTGGKIADAFVSISGASDVFTEGLVCYSNESKIKNLNVSPKSLMKYTAVSREVAGEMVRGLLSHEYNDYAVATTGYAEDYDGQANGGLVYIGVGDQSLAEVFAYKFKGDRETVRKISANAALFHLIKKIKGSFDYMG